MYKLPDAGDGAENEGRVKQDFQDAAAFFFRAH
jgi:hypothetical protein